MMLAAAKGTELIFEALFERKWIEGIERTLRIEIPRRITIGQFILID